MQVDPRGFISVDRQRRTADPHILAIGDAAGQPVLAYVGTYSARQGAEGVGEELDAAAVGLDFLRAGGSE